MPAPATTYEELKETIAAAYPRLSPQLQRLSRFALEKPHDLALGTVAAVAQANEVQPSSMIRFANALGFDGFSQMQQVFQSHLVERSAPYRERIRQMRRGGLQRRRLDAAVPLAGRAAVPGAGARRQHRPPPRRRRERAARWW